jgi:hypothetical protein
MPAPPIDKGMKGETHDGPEIRFIVVTLGLVFVLVVFVVAVFTFGSASDVTTTVTSVGGVVARSGTIDPALTDTKRRVPICGGGKGTAHASITCHLACHNSIAGF